MKHLVTKALLATVGVALAAQTASATNNYNAQGDLLLAFREAGFNDLVIDIGQASTYLNASSTINLDSLFPTSGPYTSLASLLTHQFGGTSGMTWSVGGSLKPSTTATAIYLTDASNATTPIGQTSMNNATTDINNYGLQYRNATAGNTLVPNLAASVLSSSSSSYTANGPKVTGQVGFNYENLVPSTGASTAAFYTFTPGNAGTQAPLSGFFEVTSSGVGEYVVVPAPEPTLYGVIAAAGLLALSVRRQFIGQRA